MLFGIVWVLLSGEVLIPLRHCWRDAFSVFALAVDRFVTIVRFFFLCCGQSRSKARSFHEKKLLLRKLLHGHRWSHAAWQIIKNKTETTTNTRQDADPQPDLRLAIKRTAKQTANGARAQQKQPQKICQDTVKTHCVAINSKTCSKRISCHPGR